MTRLFCRVLLKGDLRRPLNYNFKKPHSAFFICKSAGRKRRLGVVNCSLEILHIS